MWICDLLGTVLPVASGPQSAGLWLLLLLHRSARWPALSWNALELALRWHAQPARRIMQSQPCTLSWKTHPILQVPVKFLQLSRRSVMHDRQVDMQHDDI